MNKHHSDRDLWCRHAPLEMDAEQFSRLGHQLIDEIAAFLDSLPQRPITRGEAPSDIRRLLGDAQLPLEQTSADKLLKQACELLFEHSLFNGHPRFFGYITSSAAPIGALADLLVASVNPNVAGWFLAPIASEIETRTVRWIGELIGYPADCGGLLVSGGNMANFVSFLAARKASASWDIRAKGLHGQPQFTVYVSRETHTWIEKAADLFGLGTDAIRWIDMDDKRRMSLPALEQRIVADRANGFLPFMAVGTAGTVSTGAIDPLLGIAEICRRHNLWFHVDGAYGAPAAVLPEASSDLKGLALADSVAIDPHKWLYSPLEAGCTLVRDNRLLSDAFNFTPEYYNMGAPAGEIPTNYYALGPQNSRGFRALKVWLALRQVGRDGYIQMIRDDITLAELLYNLAARHDALEAVTHNLSITTLRYVPPDLSGRTDETTVTYINELNQALLNELQSGGEAFLSNAVIDGKFLLRACIVNFRTSAKDIEALPAIITRIGRKLDAAMRLKTLQN